MTTRTRAHPLEPTGPLAIVLISEHASPLASLGGVDSGGQNVHVAQLAGALADRGHRVAVYTRRDDPHLPRSVPLRPGVEVRHVPAGPARPVPKDELLPYMEAFGAWLAAEWERERPDVAHSHFWMSGVAALSACRSLGVPLAHTYHALGSVKRRHQGEADTSPPERIAWETRIGEMCDRVVATCRDEVAELTAMGVPTGHASVVPCGVDHRVFTPAGPSAPRDGRRYRLLQIGRLVPRKGAAVSLAALALLPGTELVVVGGPPPERMHEDAELRRLTVLADEYGVADRVSFVGGVPAEDVPSWLRSADVVLCPADYEPFGIVPLEAMGCGRPVIASAVGGQLDTVTDPHTGRLVPPESPVALAEAAAGLLADPAERAACGAAGRRRVLDHYGWDRVAAATERLYRDLLVPIRDAAVRAARPAVRPTV